MFCVSHKKTGGFTLVELAIVLAVSGFLFAGLWKLMSSGGGQLRDQSVATQQRQLIDAVKMFLVSPDGSTWFINTSGMVGKSAGFKATLPLTWATLTPYLPTGFNPGSTTNAYGQLYSPVIVRLEGTFVTGSLAPTSYSFLISTNGGTKIPDMDGARISGLIGGDGGFVYEKTNVCGAMAPSLACGSFGGWSLDTFAAYGTTVSMGYIASRTYVSTDQVSINPWLARPLLSGDTPAGMSTTVAPFYNSMRTDMFMRYSAAVGGDLYMGHNMAPTLADGKNIYTQGGKITGDLTGSGVKYGAAATTHSNLDKFNSVSALGLTASDVFYANTCVGTCATYATRMQSDWDGVRLYGSTTSTPWLRLQSDKDAVYLYAGTTVPWLRLKSEDTAISLYAGTTTPRLRLKSEDTAISLYAGTTTPRLRLQSDSAGVSLYTGAGSDILRLQENASGVTIYGDDATGPRLIVNGTISQFRGGDVVVGNKTGGTEESRDLTVWGTITAHVFMYDSDRRLKENIQPLEHAIEKLKQLNPVSYVLKSTKKPSLGFVAQEVEEVYPQLVSTNENGYKAVNYGGLIAPLVQAVKKLEEDNDALKKEVEDLKGKTLPQ